MTTVIEFLGHAGSGKSFLAKRLVDVLGEDDCVGTESFSMRTSDVLAFVTANPGTLLLILRYVWSSRQSGIRSFFKSFRRVLVYYVKLRMASQHGKRFIIVGEGALKIFNDMRTTSTARNFSYADIPLSVRKQVFSHSDVMIFVFSSLEVVARRLALRENPQASSEDVKAQLTRIEGNFQRSITDNRKNLRVAGEEHEFKLIEFENGETSTIRDLHHLLVPLIHSDSVPGREDASYSNIAARL